MGLDAKKDFNRAKMIAVRIRSKSDATSDLLAGEIEREPDLDKRRPGQGRVPHLHAGGPGFQP